MQFALRCFCKTLSLLLCEWLQVCTMWPEGCLNRRINKPTVCQSIVYSTDMSHLFHIFNKETESERNLLRNDWYSNQGKGEALLFSDDLDYPSAEYTITFTSEWDMRLQPLWLVVPSLNHVTTTFHILRRRPTHRPDITKLALNILCGAGFGVHLRFKQCKPQMITLDGPQSSRFRSINPTSFERHYQSWLIWTPRSQIRLLSDPRATNGDQALSGNRIRNIRLFAHSSRISRK